MNRIECLILREHGFDKQFYVVNIIIEKKTQYVHLIGPTNFKKINDV